MINNFEYSITETVKQAIETSIHSPGQFRVLGPLRNLKEFSRDFSCPIGKLKSFDDPPN